MVLLVDDQAMVGEAVRRYLSNLPRLDFHFCSNAEDAVQVANRIQPTVILQDLVMPNIDGLSLVRQYRANPATKDIPIIVLSTKEDPVTKSDSFAAGANDYLVKLPDRVELVARIRYHSRAYSVQLQRDAAYRALRESQQQLVDSNTALITLNQKLEDATRAKSDFLANISHELRTPMNGILGMANLMLDTEMSVEQQDFLTTVRTSADALLAIVNDVLDFSKIESGRIDLEEHPFELHRCLEEALELIAPNTSSKNLDLGYILEDTIQDRLKGDVTRLRQILVNLVGNAAKFTTKGEVVLTVSQDPGESQPQTNTVSLHFRVRDTGIGIPSNRLDRLFKSFSQVDSSTTRNFGGTGLGLVISKRLCELMGGRMWVESEPGVGSTFHFTILFGVDAPQPTPGWRLAQQGLAGKTVLLLEDSSTNRQIIAQYAGRWGIRVINFSRTEEALEWLRSGGRADAAIVDLQDPDGDGFTRVRRLLTCMGGAPMPIVFLSSVRLRAGDASARDLDVSLFVYKPIRCEQLLATLKRAFGDLEGPSKVGKGLQVDRSLGERLPLSILVADDNLVNQKVASAYLNKMGYRAELASNGLEVLKALETRSFDLIFLDVQMPEMDGCEAARKICERWVTGRPIMIAVTGNAMEGDREKCLESGMDDYIAKPIRVHELEAILLRYGTRCQQAKEQAVIGAAPV